MSSQLLDLAGLLALFAGSAMLFGGPLLVPRRRRRRTPPDGK